MKKRWWMLLVLLLLVGLPWDLSAATCTWDGGGADNNWKTKENWNGDVAPVSGDDLVFAGSTRLTAVNDFPNDTFFASITFATGAGAFTLSGNRLSTSAITNQSDTVLQTVSLDITSAWTPPELGSSLALWQDANDPSTVIATGGKVSQWLDRSGNGRHFTQGDGDKQPAYSSTGFFGRPGITFDGLNDHLILTGISSQITNQTHGVYWVFQRISGNGGGSGYNPTISPKIVDNAEGGALHYVKNSNNLGASYPYYTQPYTTAYDLASGTEYNNTTGYVMAFQANASSGATAWSIYRNGTLEGNTSTIYTPNTNNEGYVLAHQIGYNRYFNGVFAEVLMVQNTNASIRRLVEGYLAWKWGFSGNLPAGHPYLSQAPQTQVPALTITTAAGGLAIDGLQSVQNGLVKAGTGPLTLSGTNTYSGGTTISAGNLTLSGTTSSSAFEVSGGNLRGGSTCGALTLTSGGVAPGTAGGKGILTAGGNTNLSAGGTLTLRVAGHGTAGTDYDRLASTGTLTLGGSSALVVDLNGLASTGTADIITCSGSPTGTFTSFSVVNNPSNYNVILAYASGGVSVVVAGPRTLYWNPQGSSSDGNQAANWTTDAAGTTSIGGLNAIDTLSFGGSGANADNACTLTGDLTCASLVGTGYTGTLNDGGYTLTVNGNTTFVSGMTLNATGTLVMGATATLTTGGKSLKNLTANTGILTLGDACAVTGALTVGAALVLPNAVLTVNSTATSTISGQISGGGASAGITKSGAGGSLTLSSATGNSYTGSTTVSGGSLLITNTSGSATSNGTVTVTNGGTLANTNLTTGIISGSVTVQSGGTLSPAGSNAGGLACGSLILSSGAVLPLTIGTNTDVISVTGDLVLAGDLTISDGGSFPIGSPYTWCTYTGSLTDNRPTIVSLPGVNHGYIDSSTANVVKLVASAGANTAPTAVSSCWPTHCPDAGAVGPTGDLIDTYGRTLNPRPRLLWAVPADAQNQPLHFQVYLDSTNASTLVGDSRLVTHRSRFAWKPAAGAWGDFPANGADAGSGTARFVPTADLAADTAHFFQVLVSDGCASPVAPASANRFLRASAAWTDNLVPGSSRIRAIYITELRSEANRTRLCYGLGLFNGGGGDWTDPILTSNQSPIRALHFTELRSAMTAVRDVTGTSVIIGAEAIVAGTPIRTTHTTELRTALEGL